MLTLEPRTSLEAEFCSADTGPIRRLVTAGPFPGEPSFAFRYAMGIDSAHLGAGGSSTLGSGAALGEAEASLRACGEYLERYCASFVGRGDVCKARGRDLRGARVSFADSPYARLGPSDCATDDEMERREVEWSSVEDLRTGESAYAPATCIYLPMRRRFAGPAFPIISTGLAFHSCPVAALNSALCELVERDAFIISWQLGRTLDELDEETLSPLNRLRWDRFASCGYRIWIGILGLDIDVPAVVAVLASDDLARPAYTVASAAAATAESAVAKVLDELALTHRLCLKLAGSGAIEPWREPAGKPVRVQLDHLLHWSAAHGRDLPLRPGRKVGFDEWAERWPHPARRSVRDRLAGAAAASGPIFYKDITPSDVKLKGYSAIRVFAPKMHPLTMGSQNALWAGERWERFAGARSRPNLQPHPFP